MRRLTIFVLIATLTLSACKRQPSAEDAPPEVAADLLSAFDVNDPRATIQMTRGFYALDGNTWRWTAPEFSVVLAVPPGSVNGARVELNVTVPEVVFDQTGPLTLTASAKGQPIGSQQLASAAEHVFTADVPAALLDSEAIAIDFTTDKHINPGGEDNRDLALIATRVGFAKQ